MWQQSWLLSHYNSNLGYICVGSPTPTGEDFRSSNAEQEERVQLGNSEAKSLISSWGNYLVACRSPRVWILSRGCWIHSELEKSFYMGDKREVGCMFLLIVSWWACDHESFEMCHKRWYQLAWSSMGCSPVGPSQQTMMKNVKLPHMFTRALVDIPANSWSLAPNLRRFESQLEVKRK